ncbi:hypothetical protein GYMLUDRAFT_168344, partial [Collybiopsis luxurians FD-317 M1]
LPHITIQCPVYKESLELTIAPLVFSIQKAGQTYARQAGTSSILLCDDGLIIAEERSVRVEANRTFAVVDYHAFHRRLEFYSNHNIA